MVCLSNIRTQDREKKANNQKLGSSLPSNHTILLSSPIGDHHQLGFISELVLQEEHRGYVCLQNDNYNSS